MLRSQGGTLTAHGHMSSHSQVDPTGIQSAILLPTPPILSLHWWRGDGKESLCAFISSTTEQVKAMLLLHKPQYSQICSQNIASQ